MKSEWIMDLDVEVSGKPGYLAGHAEFHLDDAPCPFCGIADATLRNTWTPYYWVECNACGARGPDTEVQGARSANRIRRPSTMVDLHQRAGTAAYLAWTTRALSS